MLSTRQVHCEDPSTTSTSTLDELLQRTAVAGFRPDGTEEPVNQASATHFSINGGKYLIPMKARDAPEDAPDPNGEFLRLYTEAFARCKPLFLVERRTPAFAMHMDLDIIDTHDVQIEEMRDAYLRTIQRVMRSFYADDTDRSVFVCIVLSAPIKRVVQKQVDAAGEMKSHDCFKSGFHLHWPNLVVDEGSALTLRCNIVWALEQEVQRQWPQNSVNDIIDECVFTKNGLRMVGSDKVKKCCAPACTNGRIKRGYYCNVCLGKGRVPEKRVYTLRAAFDADISPMQQYFDEMHAPEGSALIAFYPQLELLVKRCSIRTNKPVTPGFFTPNTAIAPVTRRTEGAAKRGKAVSMDVGGKDSNLFKCIQLVLRQNVHEAYADVRIASVDYYKGNAANKRSYRVKVNAFSPGSLYCQNVSRAHKSSNIYFVISEHQGIVQRCFSEKYNCKAYSSPPLRVPDALKCALFPIEEDVLRVEEFEGNAGEQGRADAQEVMDAILAEAVPSCFAKPQTSSLKRRRAFDAVVVADDNDVTAAELAYFETNGKWKPVDTHGRALHKKVANGAVRGLSTNCKFTWDEIDKMNMRTLRRVEAKRQKNDTAAKMVLQQSATRAHDEVKHVIASCRSTDPSAIARSDRGRFTTWTRPRTLRVDEEE